MINLSRPIVDSVGPLVLERQAARLRLTEWRTTLPESDFERLNCRLLSHLLRVLSAPAMPRGVLAVYNPIRAEPDLRPIFANLRELGYSLALPVVINKRAPLQFLAWESDATLVRDACGLWVPQHNQSNPFLVPKIVLAPCVGFSSNKFRLGYGGGYYDRTLPGLKVYTIGVGFAACEIRNLAVLETDQALQQIVTELGSL
jgi:5-formyltetrahydrofolate cyclo-ligase